MNIRLVGHRCTGKTSVGRLLASKLGFAFLDTDELLEARQGMTIRNIVAKKGWEVFRAIERKILLELLDRERAILALGGGVVLDPQNRRDLRARGINVWLLASHETILRRMRQDPRSSSSRPPLKGFSSEEELPLLIEEREPLYEEVAHIKVETDERPLEEIVEEIIANLSLITQDPENTQRRCQVAREHDRKNVQSNHLG